MIFIIEGVDKSGKSTFARQFLQVSPDMCYVKRKINYEELPKNEEQLVKYLNDLRKMVNFFSNKKMFSHVIFDRFYPSEGVYSAVKRGFDSMKCDVFWNFDNYISKRDVKIIYVETDPDIILTRLTENHDDYVKAIEINELIKRYKDFLRNTNVGYFKVNGNEDNTLLMHKIFNNAIGGAEK